MASSSNSPDLQGIPTADEEALQAPEFDPVFHTLLLGLLGPEMGLRIAGQTLFAQGLGMVGSKQTQYLFDNGYVQKNLEPLLERGRSLYEPTADDPTTLGIPLYSKLLGPGPLGRVGTLITPFIAALLTHSYFSHDQAKPDK